jgi:hypothetical protein
MLGVLDHHRLKSVLDDAARELLRLRDDGCERVAVEMREA